MTNSLTQNNAADTEKTSPTTNHPIATLTSFQKRILAVLAQEARYGLASGHRRQTLDILATDGPLTPTTIGDETGLDITHVSRVLSDLQGSGLATILNPDARKGRLYDATSKGTEIADVAAEVDG
ncbi:hypothetical protein JT689_01545 (plasmid) [Halobacterium sp. GSL-19]|uniref:hypothetical protein n=1 Tax=Halobacterium sp. GSL-19 TaxID=2812551 RepID=UPI0019657F73|nr:hypothetical protein [Halobacterium sp. GSL-19]QRY21774.1 hypothetical protein JT689_01545 [Halobacterium sp. GSL-19]